MKTLSNPTDGLLSDAAIPCSDIVRVCGAPTARVSDYVLHGALRVDKGPLMTDCQFPGCASDGVAVDLGLCE